MKNIFLFLLFLVSINLFAQKIELDTIVFISNKEYKSFMYGKVNEIGHIYKVDSSDNDNKEEAVYLLNLFSKSISINMKKYIIAQIYADLTLEDQKYSRKFWMSIKEWHFISKEKAIEIYQKLISRAGRIRYPLEHSWRWYLKDEIIYFIDCYDTNLIDLDNECSIRFSNNLDSNINRIFK